MGAGPAGISAATNAARHGLAHALFEKGQLANTIHQYQRGKHVMAPHEAWIATDQQGRVRVTITGPHGFQRSVIFAADETPAVITEMVRATLEE